MSVILPAAEVPGAAQETTSTAILAAVGGLESDLATLAAVDFATEATATGLAATVTKLRKWPYADYDAQVFTPATGTATWEYKTGGATGTGVGTILITYTDATKGTIANITYTPEKVV
jgi:hypothetical protein